MDLARRCALLAFTWAVLARAAAAALLPDFPDQRVRAGDTLELPVTAESADVDVYIERSPSDAELVPVDAGRWTLRWTTPSRGEGRHVIRLGAVDRSDRARRQSAEVVVLREAADAAAPAPVDTGRATAPTTGPAWRLPTAAPDALVAGRDWELRLPVLAGDALVTGAVRTTLRGAPAGLDVTRGDDGWLDLRWRPAPTQIGTHAVELTASDPADPLREARRRLVFEVRPVVVEVRPVVVEVPAARHDAVRPGPAFVAAAAAPRTAPRLGTLANQIVSTGTAVAFKVRAAGTGEAVVQVDRLPRNASFDENPDGSRTFYWPTSDRDQGEHRFRFTARDPGDPSLADRTDVLVVVGDPSRGRTVPAGDPVP